MRSVGQIWAEHFGNILTTIGQVSPQGWVIIGCAVLALGLFFYKSV